MQGKGKPCQFAEKSEARENNGERGLEAGICQQLAREWQKECGNEERISMFAGPQ